VGSVNGLAAVRSLGRNGIDVTAVGSTERDIGLRSRYARPLLAPSPRTDPAGFLEALRQLGERLPEPAPLFATADAALQAISRGRVDLADRFLLGLPERETLERAQDKAVQLAVAAEAGVPTPRTAREPTAALGFPVLVKPSLPVDFRRRFRTQAFLCRDEVELAEAFERALPYEPLVQEWIGGGDDQFYQYGAYLDEAGNPLAAFGCRKLRQTRAGVGTCRTGEAFWSDELAELSLALVRQLGLHGFVEVEFKRDPRDRQLKLIEVNTRLWQWHGLASACGVDFPVIAYEHLTTGFAPPASVYRGSRRWSITLLPGSGAGEGEHPLRPAVAGFRYVDAVFAADDPRPTLHQLHEAGRAVRLRLQRARGHARRAAAGA
jgi:predicted ATP-grasp superfamily ATP-dependent carboligase